MNKSLYDGEPWAELVKKMNWIPEDVEAQARQVAEFAADKIAKLEQEVNRACQWKPITRDNGFVLGCGGSTGRWDVPDFCPWCGGKVEVK